MRDRFNQNSAIGNIAKTHKLVTTGLFFAVALVLSIIESALPEVPLPVPGVKLGLSNIAVMYALFFLSRSQAFTIAVLKAIFVLITRGITAGILSFFGGILSLTVMLLLLLIFSDKISYLLLSISGAVAHNTGQFAAVTFIYPDFKLWAYLPILIISGVAAGVATAALLRFILPAFNKLVR